MTIHAVFPYRSMFPGKWTAFFGVAGVAELIQIVGLEHRAGRRPVRIVAILAGHLALRYRHVRTLVEFSALLLVSSLD